MVKVPSRFKRYVGVGVSLLVGLVAAAGCSPVREASPAPDEVVGEVVELGTGGEDVVIGLTYVPNVQFAPVYVAGADEVFRASGVGASIRHHGADEGLFTALMAGDEDVTIASGDEVLQARAAGLDIVSIGSYYNTYPVVLLAKEDSGITSVQDLRGKKVGVPGEFGSNWFGLLAALELAEMEVGDIDVVSVGFTQAASLASGQVDAIVGFLNSEAVQLAELGVPVTVIPLAEEEVPLVGASIVTTRKWAEENPTMAQAVVDSITVGKERVIASPQHALEVTGEWDPNLSDAESRAHANEMLLATAALWDEGDGQATSLQDLELWQAMAPFLARSLDLDQDAMDVEGAVTNEYSSR